MNTSQIPVFKAWYVDLLSQADELADVKVQYGREPEEPDEVVAITDSGPNWEQEWVGVGQDRARDEKFSLTIYVIVKGPGLEQQEATERAFEIFAAVEQLTLDKTTTAGELDQVLWMKVDTVDFSELPQTEGYAALIEARVSTHTRI